MRDTAYLLTPALGFLLGFALARSNSCTVASTRRLIHDRRGDWMFGLATAISWAGLVLIGLTSMVPTHFRLPAEVPISAALLLGSVMIGFGAFLNRACFLGSVAQLSRGNLNYLFTLVGIALALRLNAPRTTNHLPVAMPDLALSAHGPAAQFIAIVLFCSIASLSLLKLYRRRRATMLALIMVGLSGGLIYATNPDWSYTTVIDRVVHGTMQVRTIHNEMAAIALFLGALLSATLREQFSVVTLSKSASAGCLIGGIFMGMGARMIPGGNDTLMLWSIPGLTLYGLISYAIMIFTIALLLIVSRRFEQHPPRAGTNTDETEV